MRSVVAKHAIKRRRRWHGRSWEMKLQTAGCEASEVDLAEATFGASMTNVVPTRCLQLSPHSPFIWPTYLLSPMANATDSGAHRVHGTDPQYLIEKIIRQRIYDSPYWKEKCFGLDAATLVDQAVQLTYCGGMYSEHIVPTPFLCLTLKLLQLSPPMPIIVELLQQSAYKYVRLLAALHVRLTARAEEVYGLLDGLLSDWRKVRRRREDGTWELLHVDELVDEMLVKERCCSVTLPRMAKREQLITAGKLEERKSALVDMMDEEKEEDKLSKEKEEGREAKEAAAGEADERRVSEESQVRQIGVQSAAGATAGGDQQATGVSESLPARPRDNEEERHRRRSDDRSDRRSERRERDRERDRIPLRRRDDRDDTHDTHRRHGSSSSSSRHHHRRRDSSPSRSRSPNRDRRSRRRERDDDRERRHRDDRHSRRRRSRSSSRSRSYSPRHHSSRRRSSS